MKALLQRVSYGRVKVDGTVIGEINKGFVLLLGIGHEDQKEDVDYLIKKVSKLRVFEDENGKMNKSLHDTEGEILMLSHFPLYASTRKGNRPSFTDSAPPTIAIPLYEQFIAKFKETGLKVESGKFGADMKVELLNDGPVTIIIDSKDR